jgi:hypothetical protein
VKRSERTPIAAPTPKPDWLDIVAVLVPPPILTALYATIGHYAGLNPIHFLANNWGNLISGWGLYASVYVLFVTQGARAAARQAANEAEEATKQSKASAKVREALDELKETAERNTQIRIFADAEEWGLVQLRAEEIKNTCRTTVERWAEDATLEQAKNELLDVAIQMEGIIKQAAKGTPAPKRIESAQIIASNKLSTILGKVLKKQDSGSK